MQPQPARHCSIAIVAVFLTGVLLLPATRVASQPPNILFILADDLGWPDLGCYGHALHETPRIDELAAAGMRFTDFYAATPVCSSTRATIQTGQYSPRTGITDFIPGHWRPFERLIVPPVAAHLPSGTQTPGHLLKQAGYTTAYFGKWHLGTGPDQQPDRWGYDVTAAQLGPDFQRWRPSQRDGPKSIDLLTDQTLYFMQQHRERPFFVTLSHYAVHIPIESRGATLEKYQQKQPPRHGVNHPGYAAMIEDLDHSIGRLLDRLREWGILDRTMVIFTSDNGGLRKIFTGVGEVVSTNAPLRGEKGTLYEGGIRVPLIVRWPPVVPSGATCNEPATTADLLPTFCDIAKAAGPTHPVDGVSLLRLLSASDESLDREAIFFHYPHYHHSRPAGAIRAGDWKLIEYFDDAPAELYNLATDLGEQVDLADEQVERADGLRKSLAAWRQVVGARLPTPNPDHDASRAGEWWNRGGGRPADVQRMEAHYRSRTVGQ